MREDVPQGEGMYEIRYTSLSGRDCVERRASREGAVARTFEVYDSEGKDCHPSIVRVSEGRAPEPLIPAFIHCSECGFGQHADRRTGTWYAAMGVEEEKVTSDRWKKLGLKVAPDAAFEFHFQCCPEHARAASEKYAPMTLDGFERWEDPKHLITPDHMVAATSEEIAESSGMAIADYANQHNPRGNLGVFGLGQTISTALAQAQEILLKFHNEKTPEPSVAEAKAFAGGPGTAFGKIRDIVAEETAEVAEQVRRVRADIEGMKQTVGFFDVQPESIEVLTAILPGAQSVEVKIAPEWDRFFSAASHFIPRDSGSDIWALDLYGASAVDGRHLAVFTGDNGVVHQQYLTYRNGQWYLG